MFFLFLTGCTPDESEKDFDVSLYGANHKDIFIEEKNATLDQISFVMKNNEDFPLDCQIIFKMDNVTERTSKVGAVGLLDPGERKNISLSFEMFLGYTDINIIPKCRHLEG